MAVWTLLLARDVASAMLVMPNSKHGLPSWKPGCKSRLASLSIWRKNSKTVTCPSPARRVRLGEAGDAREGLADFALFGPTCDSADRMRGPFQLPADMREGDWVELGQLGAYGACLRTGFNGFGRTDVVEVTDLPMLETPGY